MSEQPILPDPFNQPNQNKPLITGTGETWSTGRIHFPPIYTVPLPTPAQTGAILDSEGQGSPSHYDGYALLDFIEKHKVPFAEASVFKYVFRHAKKNGAKDIDKAIDYLNQIKRLRYSEPNRKQ